jgi:hypothetical protein
LIANNCCDQQHLFFYARPSILIAAIAAISKHIARCGLSQHFAHKAGQDVRLIDPPDVLLLCMARI